MDLEPVPLEHTCLGCKRYFLLHECLPVESMTVEFKNYLVPVRESYLKQVLLRTIVAFMNSKGGTIYMGVDDYSGKVIGMELDRKCMDEFRLVVKQMLERVEPAVDLIKEEQVAVEFLPVLQGKERYFHGKYVIKFIIQQGDTSKLYCVSEKIKSKDDGIVETISAFRRHNLGGIEELKGIKVVREIYEKARNPYKQANTFHKDCNPQPLMPALIQRPKAEKIARIFADEDSPESQSGSRSKRSSSQKKKSGSQVSENGTIIDKIEDLEREAKEKKLRRESNEKRESQDPFRVIPQKGYNVYFENVRPLSIKSLINFLKNSTHAKYGQQLDQQNGIIVVKFKHKSERDTLIDHVGKDPMRRLINDFGTNGKVNVFTKFTAPGTKAEGEKHERSRDKYEGLRTAKYKLLFYGYLQAFEGSIENYLKNCINRNIDRRLKRTKDGLEYTFDNKRDMNTFFDMCINPPHSKQLGQFWQRGIKVKKLQATDSRNLNSKEEGVSVEKPERKMISEEKNLPDLLNMIDKMDQETKPRMVVEIESMELIASSLEPSEVPKLSNYLVNNMFYNIQKKIFASKDRYYLRIVFNSTQDCKEFLNYCRLEQHKNMLAQFAGSKAFRIGVPGDNLIISPYCETVKEDLKKLIIKLLGVAAVKKSSIKEVGEQKVWSLTLVDPSKVMEYYEKLESFLRKEGFFLHNEWYRFKVFLDYQNLSE